MMTWGNIILAILSLVEWAVRIGQENKWIAQGRDEEIARATAEILRKTNYAKASLEEFAGKSDSDVDDFLRGLGGDSKPSG